MSSRLGAGNGRGAALALTAFAIYSAHDVIVKTLGGLYSPIQVLFFATLFGFPGVTVMMMRDRSDGNLRPRHPWLMLLRTVLGLITASAGFYAFSVLPMAEAYAIIFASPLLITLLAIPALGERVGWRRSLAVALGLVGVLIVLQPGGSPLSFGHAAALTAAICSAGGAVIVRKIGSEERSAVLMLYPMTVNLVATGLVLPFVYQPMPALHLGGLALMAAMGLTAGLFQIGAYRAANAGIVAPMQYSQIVWAVLYGTLFFNETPAPATAFGAAIIIGSGVYVVFREESSVAGAEASPAVLSPIRRLGGSVGLLRRQLAAKVTGARAEGRP